MPPDPQDDLFQFASPDDSSGFVLWQVNNLWQRRIRQALAEVGLTHVQFVLLACLGWLTEKGDQPVTQVRLAAQARTDVMMTSKVLRALEDMGLVERHEHPADPRARSLRVTPAGREMVYKAVRLVDAVDRGFFAALGQGEDDFRAGLLRLRDGADRV